MAGVVYSRVGHDELGDGLRAFLESHGLPLMYLQTDAEHPTGHVTVDLSVVESPEFTIAEDVAWDHLELTEPVQELAAKATAICFGTLAQRSPRTRAAVHGLLSAASDDCLTVYDVNLRPPWYEKSWIEDSLRAARIVKLNRTEVREISALLEIGSEDPIDVARFFQANFDVELVCATRSSDGCMLIDRDGVGSADGVEVDAVDPVGAGDAFTAALIYAQLKNWSLQVKATFANQIASLVAGEGGAMPDLSDEFAREVNRFN
jgi:fructokinase